MRHRTTVLLALALCIAGRGEPSLATAAGAKRKPPAAIAFDPAWIEPFFKKGPAKAAAERFREEDWSAAEVGFARAAKTLPASSPERRAARYLLALAMASQSKWAEAGALFEDLYASYPSLAAYHAYGAARCRLRRGDAAGALEWAARVPDGAIPEADTALVRVDALRALGRWEDAAIAIQAYLDRFPAGPRRAEALFKKGEALEKLGAAGAAAGGLPDLTADATAAYRRVWAEAPLEPWADRASERIAALAQKLPPEEGDLVRTHIAAEWVTRGMVLFDKNRNAESEAAFTAALSAVGLDADLECRARFHRAQSAWKQHQRARAAPLFDEAEPVCTRAGNADLAAKALYQAGRGYAFAGDRDSATARFARVEAEHVDHSYADDARLRTAELASDAGDDATAAQVLSEIPTRYPKGDQVNEALWRLAFGAWRAGRYDDALHWLDENLRLIPHEEIWYAEGRVPYWKGRVFERQGKPDLARAWYERAVREYPLSVYALLALERLQSSAPKARAALLRALRPKSHAGAWSFAARPLFGEPGFLRAVELARMGQGEGARRELARLGLSTTGEKGSPARGQGEDEDLLWITAILLDRGGLWSASHSIPRYTLTRYALAYPQGMGEAKWKLAYPRAFAALVVKDARASQIPEALQLAIMREESAFSPRIESASNAVGLTQLLIKTARRFANGASVTRDVLMDPAKNLEFGSRYLGFLWKRYGGAAPLAIAGYNAGEGAVDHWLGAHPDLAMDELMETIPYDETRNYTKRVLASYFAYSWLYADHPVPEIVLAASPRAGGLGPPANRRSDVGPSKGPTPPAADSAGQSPASSTR